MTDDIVLRRMIEKGVPLTRANYLDMAYMGNPPDEIGGEIEASIPWEIKHAEEIALMAQMDFPFDAADAAQLAAMQRTPIPCCVTTVPTWCATTHAHQRGPARMRRDLSPGKNKNTSS